MTHQVSDRFLSRALASQRVWVWIGRGLLVVWAAFWLWFNIASAIGERDGTWHHVFIAAITLALTLVCWLWPRIGGVLMVAAAVLAASAFPNKAALTLLALPAAAIGVMLLLASPRATAEI